MNNWAEMFERCVEEWVDEMTNWVDEVTKWVDGVDKRVN